MGAMFNTIQTTNDLRGMVYDEMNLAMGETPWEIRIVSIDLIDDTVLVTSDRLSWYFNAGEDGIYVAGFVDGESVLTAFWSWYGVGSIDGSDPERMTFSFFVSHVVVATEDLN